MNLLLVLLIFETHRLLRCGHIARTLNQTFLRLSICGCFYLIELRHCTQNKKCVHFPGNPFQCIQEQLARYVSDNEGLRQSSKRQIFIFPFLKDQNSLKLMKFFDKIPMTLCHLLKKCQNKAIKMKPFTLNS